MSSAAIRRRIAAYGTPRRLLLSSLSGVFLTIAVAWSIALLTGRMPELGGLSRRHLQGAGFSGDVWEESWYGFRRIDWIPDSDVPASGTSLDELRTLSAQLNQPLPRWLGWPHALSPPLGRHATMAFGWPCKAIRSGVEPIQDGLGHRTWGIWLIRPQPPARIPGLPDGMSPGFFPDLIIIPARDLDQWKRGSLPISPIWPGFIVNVLVWTIITAVASSVLAATWKTMVRRIRTFQHGRRNRCPKCGYSLEGLIKPVCPECGGLLARRAGTAAERASRPVEPRIASRPPPRRR